MGTAFGTPRYNSPEQALASEKSVPQSDVYSLAVIVYEMLTGSMVFKADTAMQIALSHISEPPPPPRVINPQIPRSVEREVLKALSKQPEERHPTANDFIAAIEEAYGSLLTDEQADSPEVVSTKTPVMRPPSMEKEIAKHVARSKQVKGIEDTDTLPSSEPSRPVKKQPISAATPAAAPIPASEPAKKGKRSPLPLLIGILVIAAAGIFAMTSLPGDEADPTPAPAIGGAATDEANSDDIDTTADVPAIQPLDDGIPATIFYETRSLAVRNNSKDAIDLSEISFVGANGENTFDSSDMTALSLGESECISVLADSGNSEVDPDWGCAETSTDPHVRPASGLFWRAVLDGSNDHFEVRLGDTVIAQCDATTAGRASECDLDLPVLQGADE